MIPTIITQIANGAREIKLGSLTPTRDFSYVKDTVVGFITALQAKGGLGEVINLGSNFEISIKETAQLIGDTMGASVEIVSDEIRLRPENSEVERLWADTTKAKDLLHWEPIYGGREGFQRGLAETIEWFTKTENLRAYKSGMYNL